jgi:GTP-binding protein
MWANSTLPLVIHQFDTDNAGAMAQAEINQYYRRASFLISAGKPGQFPRGEGAEVAFAGRSNAGKSSAINTLCGNKGLAKTSKTPGRTRLINFFTLDQHRRLVDLPGYGYAKVPEKMKQEWEQLMEAYLQQQQSLRGLVIIMDIRHPMKDFDWQMLEWCHYYNLPAHVLLTKADKLKRGPQQNSLLSVRKQLKESGSNATVQVFSALKQTGLDELVAKLNEWLELD